MAKKPTYEELEQRVRELEKEAEWKQKEEALQQANILLHAIHDAQSRFIADVQPQEIFERLLSALLELTESEYGFIGEVLYTSDGAPYLKTYAITNIAWNDEMRAFYDTNAPKGMNSYNLKTLFGAVIKTGRPVISNNPSWDSRRGGLPKGHPPVHTFMGLPFYHGNTLHGMVGMANHLGGYDDVLVVFLQPFLATCSNIIAAVRIDQQRRMAEEKLRTSEERYRTVVEDMPAMICRFLPDGTLTFVNSMYCQYFDRQKDELIGHNFFQFIPAEDQDNVKDHFMSLCQEKPMITYEHQVFAPDGTVLWQEWTDRALFNETGSIIEYQSIGREISDRKRAEDSLKQALEWQQAIFEGSQDAIFISDSDSRFVSMNRAACELTGYTEEELLSMRIPDLHEDVDLKAYHMFHDQIMAGEEITSEAKILRKDSRKVDTEFSNRRIIISNTPYMHMTARDISRRKQMEASIQASEERYRSFVQNFQGIAYRGTIDFVPLFFHGAVEKITGYTEEEFIAGRPRWDQVIYSDDMARISESVEKIRTIPNYATEREYRIIHKEGQIRWIYELVQNICDDAGQPVLVQGAIYDISARKQIEEVLRFTRFAVDRISDAAFWIRPNAQFIYVNNAACRNLGYSREELLTMAVYDIDPNFPIEVWPAHWRKVKEHSSLVFESHHRAKNGRVFPVEITANFLEFEGEEYNFIFARDISGRKQVEAERETLITELEAKNTELERFTYTVSHDLKSPLITIKGFLGLVEQDVAKSDIEQIHIDIQHIREATDTMHQLLDDLLELSRIGRLMNPPQEVPFGDLAQEAVERVAGQIAERGVHVTMRSDLPTVYGDRLRLLGVLQNLIDNAIKFMGDQSEPQIEIGTKSGANGPVLYVADNGIGIDPRYHDKVFGLFERLDPDVEGTGVGLALVKRIIEVHGGRIWVESEGPGRGSTFYFTLAQKGG